MGKLEESYIKELNIINSYMNFKNVTRATKLKIRNYLEYLHKE